MRPGSPGGSRVGSHHRPTQGDTEPGRRRAGNGAPPLPHQAGTVLGEHHRAAAGTDLPGPPAVRRSCPRQGVHRVPDGDRRAQLHTGFSSLRWVVDGYTLALSALLSAGSLGDRCGRRRLYLTGMAVFTIGSAICAASPGISLLVAGRITQGAGATSLIPGSPSILAGVPRSGSSCPHVRPVGWLRQSRGRGWSGARRGAGPRGGLVGDLPHQSPDRRRHGARYIPETSTATMRRPIRPVR